MRCLRAAIPPQLPSLRVRLVHGPPCELSLGRGAAASLLLLLASRSPAEHVFHRRAYRFISTMNTTDPATRTALALLKVRAHPVDMLTSGFRHLRRDHPADPFIARERCKALPCSKCHRVGRQGAPQIGWNAVHDTAGNTHLGDGGIIANLG